MIKIIEKIVDGNEFKDLEDFKNHIYKQFEENKGNILKTDNEEFNVTLDDFKPKFEIKYDYFNKNDVKKRWLYSFKMQGCSFNRSIMINDKYCTYTYEIAADLKAISTKGYGSISNGATNRIFKNYQFEIDYENQKTTVNLRHINLNEGMAAKEKGEDYKPVKIEYKYQGTDIYDIVADITDRLSKI